MLFQVELLKVKKMILTVRSAKGLKVKADEEVCFYSELNHYTTLKKQKAEAKGEALTVTLPIADYAPEKLEKLTGLLYHPEGWQDEKDSKYMPVSLSLE